ncbi:MAG: long-chain fatty aldehyde decarbonylase [Acidobacteriota bacterium]|nr:long-chain fatty aldehyde decarbonylase [Acidobacteriota bacterium]
MISDQLQAGAEAHRVWGSILSQSATGELIGMMNFASLVDLYEDPDDKIEALEHAAKEKAHARSFQRLGEEMGLCVTLNVNAPYWKRIRTAFVNSAGRGDFTACLIIQELMLESFAVSMYSAVARVAPGKLGKAYKAIAAEETEHLEHAIELLSEIYKRDPAGLREKVAGVHEDVMSVLAEMVAREDIRGDCLLCGNTCIKPSLPEVRLDIVQLRGGALNLYLKSLDRVGLPGEETLQWITRLPV